MIQTKKITILVFNLEHGGAEKVCLLLCNELVKRNHLVELWICNFRESSLTKHLDNRISIFKLNKKHVRNCLFPLMKLFFNRKPRKILVFHIELAVLAIVIKKLFFQRAKIIVRSINTLSYAFKSSNGLWGKYLALRVLKIVLPHSHKIIAQSSGMQKDLIQRFDIKDSQTIIIHNPAFNIKTNNTVVKENYKNEFLFVGRLSRQKGLTNLIKAFALAYKQTPNIHLTLVGEGTQRKNLKKLVNNLGLNSSITFEGFRKDTVPYYIRAKATVLTSVFEGFPNVLVESIALGTPVIAFDCPSGPADIIIQHRNGILIPNLDITAFSKAISDLANNNIQFSKEEIIKTSKNFSLNSIVNKYEQIFSK